MARKPDAGRIVTLEMPQYCYREHRVRAFAYVADRAGLQGGQGLTQLRIALSNVFVTMAMRCRARG